MGSDQIPVHRHGLPHVDVYEVREDELDDLQSEGSDVGTDFQIGSVCLTMALSFFVAMLLTPPPPKDQRTFIVVTAIIVVTFVAGSICMIKWFRHRGNFSRVMARIRARKIGPMGQPGHELNPAEAAQLPPTLPPEAGTP